MLQALIKTNFLPFAKSYHFGSLFNNTVIFLQMFMMDFYVTFGYKYIFASHRYCTIYIITQKGFYYTKITLIMLRSVSLLILFHIWS